MIITYNHTVGNNFQLYEFSHSNVLYGNGSNHPTTCPHSSCIVTTNDFIKTVE